MGSEPARITATRGMQLQGRLDAPEGRQAVAPGHASFLLLLVEHVVGLEGVQHVLDVPDLLHEL
eukprot:1220000-Alexandrium_andersonii.AAC.1